MTGNDAETNSPPTGQDGQRTKAGVQHASTPPHGGSVRQNSDGTLRYEQATGTSIFDPVLCELAYRWFSPPGGTVLDPFAGGSVRGIVASRLGRHYFGVDLRKEQVEANYEQAARICAGTDAQPAPFWMVGDSRDLERHAGHLRRADGTGGADLVFSCPPYADLEVYSDDPRDISTLDYPEFMAVYREIIRASLNLLAPDRFAVFVVGEVRSHAPGGAYYGFVPDTIKAFQDAGASFYNEFILVTALGSLPIRAGKQFTSSRKAGKTHQNVLVFVKGDPIAATAACGQVEVFVPEMDPAVLSE